MNVPRVGGDKHNDNFCFGRNIIRINLKSIRRSGKYRETGEGKGEGEGTNLLDWLALEPK